MGTIGCFHPGGSCGVCHPPGLNPHHVPNLAHLVIHYRPWKMSCVSSFIEAKLGVLLRGFHRMIRKEALKCVMDVNIIAETSNSSIRPCSGAGVG
jgi:hypothetical protein